MSNFNLDRNFAEDDSIGRNRRNGCNAYCTEDDNCEERIRAAFCRGLKEGRNEGRREGYCEGRESGFKDGRREGFCEGREAGFRDGRREGFCEGLRQGRKECKKECKRNSDCRC